MKITPLTWDSDFFQKRVGEVIIEGDGDTILNTEVFDLLYLKSNREQAIKIPNFTNTFHQTKYIFSKNLKEIEHKKEENVISIFQSSFSEIDIYSLAYLSGIYSRFFLDPFIDTQDFKRLYRKWVDNSLKKIISEDIFIYVEDSSILGFVTFKIEEKKGQIGLIAVNNNAQGKGIGSALINKVESYLIKNKINRLDIPTQASNTAACNFYKKLGYEVKESSEIYHFWRI